MLKRKNYAQWLEDKNLNPEVAQKRGAFGAVQSKLKSEGKIKDWKQADWQGEMLKDLPIKQYGRSYKDKFNKLTQDAGIPDSEIDGFKEWLGNRGQNSTPAYFQTGLKDTLKAAKTTKNKAKKAQKQYESSVVIDKDAVRRHEQEREDAERKAKKEANKRENMMKGSKLAFKGVNALNKLSGGRLGDAAEKSESSDEKGNGVFDFLSNIDKGFNEKAKGSKADRAVNRAFNTMGGSSNREVMEQLIKEGPKEGREEQYAEMVQQYEDRFGGKTTALDFGADLAGYLAPGAAAYKGARAVGLGAKGLTSGPSLRNVGQFAKEGAAAGALLGGAEVGIREDLNPENYSATDNLKHLGLNVAAGAALDPLIGLAGPVARAMNPNNMAQKALSDATTAQVERAIRFNSHTTLHPRRPSWGGPMPDSGLTEGMSSGRVRFPEAPIVPEAAPIVSEAAPVSQTPEVASPLNEIVAGPKAPTKLTAQQAAKKPTPDAPFTQKLEYFRDKNNPITEQDLPEIHARMDELHTELNAFQENFPQLREIEFQKNPKLKTQIDELHAQAKAHVDATEEWAATKEIQKLYTNKSMRPEWMNIDVGHFRSMPDEFKGIPQRFRYKQTGANANPQYRHTFGQDPYYAMEQAGFDDMEAFIGHLQNIDAQLRVKLKDVQSVSGADATKATKKLEKLESELDKHIMKNYGMDEQEKLLNELVQYSVPRQGNASVPTAPKTTKVKRSALDTVLNTKKGPPSADAPLADRLAHWKDPKTKITPETKAEIEAAIVDAEQKITSFMDTNFAQVLEQTRRTGGVEGSHINEYQKLLAGVEQAKIDGTPPPRTPEQMKSYKARHDEAVAEVERKALESSGINRGRQAVEDMKKLVASDTTPPTKKPKTKPKQSALDKTLGINKKPQPAEPEPLSDDAIEAMMARNKSPKSEVAATKEAMPQGKPLGALGGKVKDYEATPFSTTKGRVENWIDKNGTAKEIVDKLRTEVDSSLHPVKKMEAELIKKHGDALGERLPDGTLSEKDSIAKPMQMLKYSEAKAIKSYEEGDAPRQALLKKSKIPNEIADQYNLAKHARDIYDNELVKLERLGEVKTELELIEANRILNNDAGMIKALDTQEAKLLKEKDSLEPYELPEMATEKWVDSILKRFEKVEGMGVQQQMFVKEQSKNLAILRDSGHITSDVEASLMKKYPNYVPLNRDLFPIKTKGSNARNPLKRRKQGSKNLEIVNLRESALKNRIAAVSAADRAKVFESVRKLAKVDDLDGMFKRVSKHDPNFSKYSSQVIDGPNGKGGKEHYIVPPVVKEAMEASPREAFAVVEAMSKPVQLFKDLTTTYNLQFHIKALARDTNQMMAASNTHTHAGHMVMGFLDSFMGKGLEKVTGGKVKSYQAAFDKLGGDYSSFISQDKDTIQRYLRAMESGKFQGMQVFNPLKHIETFGKKSEQVARLGEFRSAKNKGYSDEDAFFEAINLLDYKDQGTLTRSVNKVSPYLNPTIRGNVRTIQAMKKPQFWKTGTAMVTVPTVINYAMRYSDTTSDTQRDKINNMPNWAKNTMWAFPVPNSDKVILYPKPFILGQMFANPIERTLDKLFEDTEKPMKTIMLESGLDMFSTLVPSVTIAGLTGISEMQANHKFFTGTPIEDRTMQQEVDPTERYNVYTSEAAKGLGKATGLSPAKLDAFLKGSLGTLGTKALDVSDNVIAKVGGERPARVGSIGETLNPLGNFLHKDASASGLYERIRKQSMWDDKEQKAAAGGKRESGYKRTEAQEVYEFLTESNKEVKKIREDLDITSKEKTEQIARIRKEQKREASRVLKKN